MSGNVVLDISNLGCWFCLNAKRHRATDPIRDQLRRAFILQVLFLPDKAIRVPNADLSVIRFIR